MNLSDSSWDYQKSLETVCLLSKLNAKQHIEINLDMDELVLNGDPETYLKAVTEYKPLD